MAHATLTPDDHARYGRQILLDGVGEAGQIRLLQSSVLVVGAGGLGSPILMYLAAAGVGRLGVVDFDRVEISNLHRQLLHGTGAIGASKVTSARDRLADINPSVYVEVHPFRLDVDNALELLAVYDVIVDASDNFTTRYLVSDACEILGKPDVYGAIFRFEGQASVFHYKGGASYRDLHPAPPPPISRRIARKRVSSGRSPA
jgi:molybdopterin/thiamine biosynthesis adenylyltransferase